MSAPEGTDGPDELSCAELVRLLTDYMEGALAPAERARLDTHLAGCEGCATYLDQMRATVRLTGRLGDEPMPPGVRDELLARLRGWRRG